MKNTLISRFVISSIYLTFSTVLMTSFGYIYSPLSVAEDTEESQDPGARTYRVHTSQSKLSKRR